VNVVDSSGWLEYLADGPTADFFAPAIENVDKLIVPTISIYEVFKRIFQQRGESAALQAIALMYQGKVFELGAALSLQAAKLSLELKLPMADSIMLASARAYKAVFWTQDAHFKGIEGVHYTEKI